MDDLPDRFNSNIFKKISFDIFDRLLNFFNPIQFATPSLNLSVTGIRINHLTICMIICPLISYQRQ